ncbi:4-(cytidine 5'-diphospho)-2-C-methyl-D-erythritol kinase [Pseudorhodobacter ferrugineus]|uniref:4-(cytidine 5'-diphospho)-2-C-methyl-D-erythritol kinase n=1 Tax=Pseudorhodobacter ferrugineus TaxID=77008 RepID=UPI0003B4399E|nr:4-(cytidine 5'-diphospho)-2-C-methyl-D-erythritol kinase [Pseudorhodobacter ferrugineus]
MINEFAYAKVNLTLHVTGQREDGYHLLDSLVVFAGIADRLYAAQSGVSSLTLEGPFGAAIPADMNNLVLRAAAVFSADRGVAFTLQKNLPPASGIGGGSADAAAAIRAILRMLNEDGDAKAIEAMFASLDRAAVLRLGADVPVCLMSHPARMRGVGEDMALVNCPECWITLVNPQVEVPTPQVFAGLRSNTNAAMPEILPDWADVRALADWLQSQRNDLEAPALAIAPVIADVLAALRAQHATLIARMSGSGATCFALSETKAEAERIATAVQAQNPKWWVASGVVYPGRAAALS